MKKNFEVYQIKEGKLVNKKKEMKIEVPPYVIRKALFLQKELKSWSLN